MIRYWNRQFCSSFWCIFAIHLTSNNVNPRLINHGFLIRGYSPNSYDLILKWYFPIKQPRGLLIQCWHYLFPLPPAVLLSLPQTLHRGCQHPYAPGAAPARRAVAQFQPSKDVPNIKRLKHLNRIGSDPNFAKYVELCRRLLGLS